MTSAPQRQTLLTLIEQAVTSGARLRVACAQIGLSVRTVRRWQRPCASQGDCRVRGLRAKTEPPNKLAPAEVARAMAVLNSDEFKDSAPSQIVPRLVDRGEYMASESTIYRLLRAANQLSHRRAERAARKVHKPRALVATGADQIYCWDITYLPGPVRGTHFYLYMYVDIFSRKIVGWQVFDCESADHAAGLVHEICDRQGIKPGQLTLHSDNGAPMKAHTMLATLQQLGVAHSRSRPSVSNDNPYSEALFHTLKYRPKQPVKPFADISSARRWTQELVTWYNEEHRHSAIRFVTPSQRHAGLDREILKRRAVVYEAARKAHPNRWSRETRNWSHITEVHLNPDKPPPKDLTLSPDT
jgi:putative transposase